MLILHPKLAAALLAASQTLYSAPATGRKHIDAHSGVGDVLVAINGGPLGFRGALNPTGPIYDHPSAAADRADQLAAFDLTPEAVDGYTAAMAAAAELVEALEDGAGADIWYDAASYGDEDDEDDPDRIAESTIETTQTAMTNAADLLRTVAGVPRNLSGGDPGHYLVKSGAPVVLTLETESGIERKASFATIWAAVHYLDVSSTIDPIDRDAGRYGIDAPHGVANDDEAVKLAQSLGYEGDNEGAALRFLAKIDPA